MKLIRFIRNDKYLSLILLFSLILNVSLAIVFLNLSPRGDQNDYLNTASYLVRHGTYLDMHRPPLYPTILAGFNWAGIIRYARIPQAMLCALSVLIIYFIGLKTFNRRIARIASTIVTFDPSLIAISHLFMTETLYIALLYGGIASLIISRENEKKSRWFFTGIVFGFAALSRSQIITYMPFFFIWILISRLLFTKTNNPSSSKPSVRPAITAILLLTAGCACIVSPWTLRNYRASGNLVIIDVLGPLNLLISSHPDAVFKTKDDNFKWQWAEIDGLPYRRTARNNPARAQTIALNRAWSNIKTRPGVFIRSSIWEFRHFWTLDSYSLQQFRRGYYSGYLPGGMLKILAPVFMVYTGVLILLALLGLMTSRMAPLNMLFLFIILHACIFFSLLFSQARYQLPFHPLFALSAAAFLTGYPTFRHRISYHSSRLRFIGLIIIILFLVYAWLLDVPVIEQMLFEPVPSLKPRLVQPPGF